MTTAMDGRVAKEESVAMAAGSPGENKDVERRE